MYISHVRKGVMWVGGIFFRPLSQSPPCRVVSSPQTVKQHARATKHDTKEIYVHIQSTEWTCLTAISPPVSYVMLCPLLEQKYYAFYIDRVKAEKYCVFQSNSIRSCIYCSFIYQCLFLFVLETVAYAIIGRINSKSLVLIVMSNIWFPTILASVNLLFMK